MALAAPPAMLAAAMLAGVGAAGWAATPALWGAALAVAAGFAAGLLRRRHRLTGAASVIVALLLGAWLAAALMAARLESRLGDAAAGARSLVVARLVSLPAHGAGQWHADAEVTVLRPQAMQASARRLRLAGPLGPGVPGAGEGWQLVIEVAPARARLNPGGFDLERQWMLERLDGFARVVESPLNRRLSGAAPGLLALRGRIRAAIAAQPADRELLALLTALAIGDTAAMTREQWRVFAATGTTHLVAISGLHVTLFAWLIGGAARPLWRALPLLQRLPREAFALPAGVLAAFLYSLLAGFSIPTQRTVLMLAVVAVARLSGRVLRPADVLGLACIGVLLLDPLAPLDVGFWLSFVAIAALTLHGAGAAPAPAGGGRRVRARLVAALREQLWIGAALAPLTLLLFGTVSVAGWLANPLAIPVFSFVLVPLSLLAAGAAVVFGAAPPTEACLAAAAAIHDGLWQALRIVAAQPWALWAVGLPIAWFVLAPLALAVAWLPLPAGMRASALLCALPLVAGAGAGPPPGEAGLTILDVGEGGAVLVRTRHHALLYGTGAAWGSDGMAVEQHVLPALRSAGIVRLDLLLLPRAAAAEVEGSARLLAGIAVTRVLAGGEWRDPPARTSACIERRAWRWDGVRFEVFAARLRDAAGRPAPGGCVLRIATDGASVVLVGGATRADFDALLATPRRSGPQFGADVLIGALRAARSAAQREFTRRVRPDWWVATRRVPTDAELEALARSQGMAGQRMLSPARHGALALRLPRSAPPCWRRAIDSPFAPVWRQPRRPLPRCQRGARESVSRPGRDATGFQAVRSASVRYDSGLISRGDPLRCGRSCGPAVR